MNRNHLFALTTLIALSLATDSRAADIDFENDVVPILEEHCWHCHGEDEQESGLRLDMRPKMLRGGDSGLPAVVPGKPDKSYLIECVNHVDEEMAMPPDEDKIPAEQIDVLVRWIKEGANWPGQMDLVDEEETDHWSFQKVVRPDVPGDGSNSNPVDAFLRERLAQENLDFSPAAKPRPLIRRVSILLTGLLPTDQETSDFLTAYEADCEAAYAQLVDRLLASPHFGERWAQHWLDVIRWAETNGSEANLYRKNAWIYRDYVTRAFNEDKPYDQFVREQIAGDTMGAGEATGFLVAGPHVPAATVGREPTAIRQARADRMDEIMQTVGASMMGVTIGCARCHNHKFDPISISDYYSMTGVFQGVEFGSRFPEFSDDHPRKQRGKELWQQIAQQRWALRRTGGWEENWGAYREVHFAPKLTKSMRIRFKMHNVGLDELEVFGPDKKDVNLAHSRTGTEVSSNSPDGVDGRYPVGRLIDGEFGTMTWRVSFDKDKKERAWVQLDFSQPQNINRLRMSSNREYFYDTDYLTKKPYLPRYEFDVDVLEEDGSWKPWTGTWSVNKDLNKKHPQRKQALTRIQSAIDLLAEEGPRPSFVGRFVRPDVTRVMHRGSPENLRDEVAPAGPAIFGGDLGLDSDAPGPSRRAAFARWLSKADNPLTSRVMANRIWHHLFGTGIVPTTSDFGTAGAMPSHPELLDWLAAEFIQPTVIKDANPWSTKTMIRLLVMSDAFRQSGKPTKEGMLADAGGSLLWRFPPKRVEAEVIRDSILLASNSLDPSVGGRSYRIHNEKKTYAQWEVVNNHGPQTWRRMLYQERMRRVDDRIFTAFDFPDCGQVRAKRPVSTTPLQALNLMNSDFVLEQSKLIAARATQDSGGDETKSIDRCFELLLGRQPADDERTACLELAKANDLSLVCRALINTNEFAFLP
ncbi:PSD1 and planctomycete cytochrome C domain-containing protein [Planctomycetes bacterium K23_9]|uniref:Planctomycete cytochrome C n=1 Tax=Stieleria marina TaxID=1930275 RepID=A0A517NU56_9BACT|nr:Planctomycete cytochrome C [Planctomycetes bacterium K23_9]